MRRQRENDTDSKTFKTNILKTTPNSRVYKKLKQPEGIHCKETTKTIDGWHENSVAAPAAWSRVIKSDFKSFKQLEHSRVRSLDLKQMLTLISFRPRITGRHIPSVTISRVQQLLLLLDSSIAVPWVKEQPTIDSLIGGLLVFSPEKFPAVVSCLYALFREGSTNEPDTLPSSPKY